MGKSVLVIEEGIAGIQALLYLADGGLAFPDVSMRRRGSV